MTAAVETAVVKKVWTEADFMVLPDDGNQYELVNGEVVVGNAGIFLGGALELYVRPRKLGVTCDSSTYRLSDAVGECAIARCFFRC